eukprot:689229-Prymnesium_polylepis.1
MIIYFELLSRHGRLDEFARRTRCGRADLGALRCEVFGAPFSMAQLQLVAGENLPPLTVAEYAG